MTATRQMTCVRVNGADASSAAATIAELLAERGIDPGAQFLAIAVNGAVVPRAAWNALALSSGDDIEIVRPFSGG